MISLAPTSSKPSLSTPGSDQTQLLKESANRRQQKDKVTSAFSAASASHSAVPSKIYYAPRLEELKKDLAVIRALLSSSSLEDDTTEWLRRWYKQFEDTLLTSIPLQTVFQEHIALLQERMKDPIFQTPLDENPLLGNDGMTYGYKSLSVYLSTIAEEYRSRFPFNLTDPTLFSTSSHPIVKHMMKWLKTIGKELPPSEFVEKEYRRLESQHALVLPPIPLSIAEKIKRLKALKEKEEQQKKEEVAALRTSLEAALRPERANINEKIERLRHTMENDCKEITNRMDKLKLDEEIANAIAKKKLDQLEKEIEELKKQNQELEERKKKVAAEISANEKANIALRQAINQTKIEIKEQEGSWTQNILSNLVNIGGSVALTLIANQLCPGAPPIKITIL